jgi:hypothetical protein
MQRSNIIAIDVDLTVVDSLSHWINWFKEETGDVGFTVPAGMSHDLGDAMRSSPYAKAINGFNPMRYWGMDGIYDEMEPLPNAVEAISAIRELGNKKIVFVSHCFPGHEESKKRFLKKHFKHDGFISTPDKWAVNYEIIIDDNPDVLKKCIAANPDRGHIQFTQVSGVNSTRAEGAYEIQGGWRAVLDHLS